MMKLTLLIMGMVFCMVQGHAQNNSISLDDFRKEVRDDFEDFRKHCMEEYAEFLRNPWKEFNGDTPILMPDEDPIPPVVKPIEDKEEPIEDNPIIIEDVIVPPVVMPQPEPIIPIEEVPIQEEKIVQLRFYGTDISIRFDMNNRVFIYGTNENAFADAMGKFSPEAYDNMLIDCLKVRDDLQLGDWAYLQMLKALSIKIFDKQCNESELLMAYLYVLSGYKMRFALNEGKLYMLYASKHTIYNQSYYNIDGDYYYGVNTLPDKLNISNAAFPNEKSMSLIIVKNQLFANSPTKERIIASDRYKDITMKVSVNKNLIDFFNSYPSSMIGEDFLTRWAIYANTPMDEYVKKQVYTNIHQKLQGMSQVETVNRILNIIQTGLVYEYDDKVWGEDRAFFAEESLFYPYCDCEDRSILFTRFVRDLLGLECILIYYPGHLASAVNITDGSAHGDYIELEGKRFFISDATYIGAPVGYTMPEMNNKNAKVILLR